SLRFHHRQASTSRSAGIVREDERLVVVRLDDQLGCRGREMRAAMREVDQTLGISVRPLPASRKLFFFSMTGIGRRRRVTAQERNRLRAVLKIAEETAAAAHQELAVPCGF